MSTVRENRSEVAQLLDRISQEYQSAYNGLHAFSSGNARHDFITSKMNNVGKLHTQLQEIVGDQAMGLIVETINQLP